jgi:hypothetical protein
MIAFYGGACSARFLVPSNRFLRQERAGYIEYFRLEEDPSAERDLYSLL